MPLAVEQLKKMESPSSSERRSSDRSRTISPRSSRDPRESPRSRYSPSSSRDSRRHDEVVNTNSPHRSNAVKVKNLNGQRVKKGSSSTLPNRRRKQADNPTDNMKYNSNTLRAPNQNHQRNQIQHQNFGTKLKPLPATHYSFHNKSYCWTEIHCELIHNLYAIWKVSGKTAVKILSLDKSGNYELHYFQLETTFIWHIDFYHHI